MYLVIDTKQDVCNNYDAPRVWDLYVFKYSETKNIENQQSKEYLPLVKCLGYSTAYCLSKLFLYLYVLFATIISLLHNLSPATKGYRSRIILARYMYVKIEGYDNDMP